jgi:hypothetical protein
MGTVVLFCDMQVTQGRFSQSEVNNSLHAVGALGLTALRHDGSDSDKIISIALSRRRYAKKQSHRPATNAGCAGRDR